ncbi:glycosylphosphatidylinositol anchor biosynthesis [Pseudocyphellaria aurata]|nr:glycosylphosphatidylinositol anchor biosynthesis [Pseudocyphellaria aurata]
MSSTSRTPDLTTESIDTKTFNGRQAESFRRRAFARARERTTSRDILLFLIAYRILNAFGIQTFFQPDEYFQSLEPAWDMAFGSGSGAWITWEWKNQLRSSIHPAIFAGIYWLSARLSSALTLSPDSHAELLIAAPKVIQAVFAALGDYYTWRLGRRIYGQESSEAWAALALTVCSPWQWFCSTRTLSNCLETTLTITALSLWPWQWALDGAEAEGIDRDDLPGEGGRRSSEELTGCLTLLSSALIDRLYYQQWTFPPLRFLHFNIAQSLAVFYGRNDWHYYLSQGYPLLLTTYLPFAVVGLYQSLSALESSSPRSTTSALTPIIKRQLALTSLLVPVTLSFISHKEVRFIYPLLPLLHLLAAPPITSYFFPSSSPHRPNAGRRRHFLLPLILLVNLTIAMWATTSHQPAPLSVLTYLRAQYTTHHLSQPPPSSLLPPAPSTMTVGFLTPCHSTPWRSHLVHGGIYAWALSCEPPLHLAPGPPRRDYLDEADQFYAHPSAWLAHELGPPPLGPRSHFLLGHAPPPPPSSAQQPHPSKAWPEYLVFFGALEPDLAPVLRGSRYEPCWTGWNGYAHEDWRRRGGMRVWCLSQGMGR